MSYISTRMPRRIASGFTLGPRWSTLLVDMDNGREQRNAQWLYPKWEGRGNMAAFDAADRQALIGLFMACRGKLHAFRVYDPTDNTATAQPIVTVGAKKYLSKLYTFGSESASRLIQAPVTATLSGAGSVNMDTGEVTGSAPGDTWTGTFDVWMRFDSDWGAFTAIRPDLWTADIELVEVRR